VDEQAVEERPEHIVHELPEGTEAETVQVDVELAMQLPLTKVKVEQREVEHSKASAWAQADQAEITRRLRRMAFIMIQYI
jgi:hypothetical protein